MPQHRNICVYALCLSVFSYEGTGEMSCAERHYGPSSKPCPDFLFCLLFPHHLSSNLYFASHTFTFYTTPPPSHSTPHLHILHLTPPSHSISHSTLTFYISLHPHILYHTSTLTFYTIPPPSHSTLYLHLHILHHTSTLTFYITPPHPVHLSLGA